MSNTNYAKRLVDRFDAVSDCEMTLADRAWLVNNVQDTIDFCVDFNIKAIQASSEKNKHLIGIIEDLYDAVDTAHLSDELRDDVREVLKGDV